MNGEELAAVFAGTFQQIEEQVLKPRLAAAGESVANGQLAIQTAYPLERWRHLAGQGEGVTRWRNTRG